MARNETVAGLAELNRALKQLSPKKQVNAIRNAARAAMKPTADRVKATAPQGTRSHRTYKGRLVAPGFSARNINITTRVSRDKLRITASVGTRPEAFYMRMFREIGTRYQSPRPTFLPAYEATRHEIEREFRIALRKKIIAQAKKVRKPRVRR